MPMSGKHRSEFAAPHWDLVIYLYERKILKKDVQQYTNPPEYSIAV